MEKLLNGKFPQFLDKNCYDVLKTEHCNTKLCRMKQSLEDGKLHGADNYISENPVRYFTSPIKDRKGNLVGIILFILDISKEVGVTNAISKITEKIAVGELAERISNEGFKGNALNIVKNVNKLIDSFTEPFQEIKQIIEQLAMGEKLAIKDNNYSGEFANIFNSVTLLVKATKTIIEIVGKIAKGELDVEIKKRSENDLLFISLEKMVNEIKKIIFDIKNAVNDIANGSKQISSASEQLAQGSSEQASNLEEISSSIEEITSSIKQTATNALNTEKISDNVAKKAEDIGNIISETVQTINHIASKITIIEDIARQTNLLALNAAIEAARVGEAGKGFAVVASEVKKLAERSGNAANEIIELAKKSVSVTEQAGESVINIIPEIKKTAELVQEISSATNEQALGIEQINDAIQQLDQVVNENAAMAEELSSSAVQFSSQTSLLRDSLKYFRGSDDLRSMQYIAGEIEEKQVPVLDKELELENKEKKVILDLSKEDIDEEKFERF
jgi:methyl-accepting chemotaxis protein